MANLNLTITEDICLNGSQRGSVTTSTILDIDEFSSRIVTATVSAQNILTTGTTIGAGQYIKTDLRYIRVTNLDPTNFIRVGLKDTSGDTAYLKVGAKETLFLYNDDIEAFTDGSTFSAFSEWDTLSIAADTASCDVQVVVASA
jgi:hypothetical protein